MSTTANTPVAEDRTALMRLLVWIERVGNKLPHPFWLFIGLAAVTVVVSWILGSLGVSAVNPSTEETVAVKSLISAEGGAMIVSSTVENFVTFPALGLVIVVMLGVAVAERSGFISALMRAALGNASPRWITLIVALTGVSASIASDAAYLVVVPLAGIAFRAVGRNPIVGCIVGYAAVSGGYDAAPMPTAVDTVLAGISTSAAQIIDPSYAVSPLSNWYFSIASTVVVAVTITVATELVLAKRGDQIEIDADHEERHAASQTAGQSDASSTDLTAQLEPAERRAMWVTLAVAVLGIAALLAMALPANSFLRSEAGTLDAESPLMLGVAPLIGFGFLILGVVYGIMTGSITKWADVPEMMIKGMYEFIPVLVMFFAASQFLAYFRWSELGQVLAIRGADFFGGLGAPSFVILLGAFLLVALGALFITSGSGLWTLLGTVLIPMLMLLGISPEATQALYRVGDSTTNIISPMSPYFVMILGFVQRYKKDAGMGTVLSFTIPLSFIMWVVWGAFFFLWYYLGIPWGPGVDMSFGS